MKIFRENTPEGKAVGWRESVVVTGALFIYWGIIPLFAGGEESISFFIFGVPFGILFIISLVKYLSVRKSIKAKNSQNKDL
ncbi:MAG: hypothetical protein WCT19_00665 [Candidatus Paceibacterota bacterium]|jgi:hypothetical protein